MNEATAVETGTEATVSQGGFMEHAATAPVVIPNPELHRGRITGVQWIENTNTEGGRLQIGLESLDTGVETEFSIFPPLTFVENMYAPIEAFSTEKPYNEETGKFGFSEFDNYSRLIKNEAGTSVLQELTKIAIAQGRTPAAEKPETLEEWAAQYNALLTDVTCVFTRSADKNPRDVQYASVLRVRRIMSPDIVDNPKRMKYYTNPKQGYIIAWQQ